MKKYNFFLISIIAVFLLRIIFSFVIWHPDLNNHMDWGIRFFEYGPSKFYAPESNVWSFTWPNQPPGTTYMFAGIRILFEFIFNIFWQINVNIPVFPSIVISYFETNLYPALLKLPAILADFGIAYLIFKIVKKISTKKDNDNLAKVAALVWLVNPVIWYNSTIWGQYDAVINFFALFAFYMLSNKKLFFGIMLFALSIYIKASLLIFAPIFLIFAFKQNFKVKDWLISSGITLFVISFITFPFSEDFSLIWLYELYAKKIFVQQLHVITANAFNLWAGVAGIHERPDSLPFLGLTYQIWGVILFTLSYIPLLYRIYLKPNLKNLIWVLALTAFSSFVLMTNMHERYIYPLFPYITILFVLRYSNLLVYSLVSLITLLGMYNFWFTPRIEPIVSLLSFGDRLMPRILGFLMFGLFISVYFKYLRSNLKD